MDSKAVDHLLAQTLIQEQFFYPPIPCDIYFVALVCVQSDAMGEVEAIRTLWHGLLQLCDQNPRPLY